MYKYKFWEKRGKNNIAARRLNFNIQTVISLLATNTNANANTNKDKVTNTKSYSGRRGGRTTGCIYQPHLEY